MNKYTKQDLLTMQSWSLDRKIQVAQTRIIEWYVKHQGQVYVSFSGGKDSTVLLDLARRVYPDIPAVFVDTGLEYPEIRNFVKTVNNVTWLRPAMNFKKVIETYGYPVVSKRIAGYIASARNNPDCVRAKYLTGEIPNKMFGGNGKWAFLVDSPFKISDKCCGVMKEKPLNDYAKQNSSYPIVGTMACESQSRRAAWLQNGCNAFDGKEPKSQPISFWTEQDVLEYIKRFSIPYSSIYGDIVQDQNGKYRTTGAARTGCMFCMFGVHIEKEPNRFQRMKVPHPKQYEFCMKPTTEGGLGLEEILDLIGVKY